MRKKLLSILALLMTAATGAWGITYTVTFAGFENGSMNTSVEYSTMPQTISSINGTTIDVWSDVSIWNNEDIQQFLEATVSGGNGQVSANCGQFDLTITVNGPFDGTATICVRAWDTGRNDLYRNITVTCTASGAATYPVTYDANGGTGAPDAQEKEEDLDLVLSSTVPTRDGYTFTGWNTAADGSGDNYDAGATYTANAAVTLYAQWTLTTYPINVKNGTEDISNWAVSPTPSLAGQAVTATYRGKKKVKSVKAVKKQAPVESEGGSGVQDYNWNGNTVIN